MSLKDEEPKIDAEKTRVKTPFETKIEAASTTEQLYEVITTTLEQRGYDGKYLMGKIVDKIKQVFYYEENAGSMDRSSVAGLEALRTEDLQAEMDSYMSQDESYTLIMKIAELRFREAKQLTQEQESKRMKKLNERLRADRLRRQQELEEARKLRDSISDDEGKDDIE